jgi:uncharacterized protein
MSRKFSKKKISVLIVAIVLCVFAISLIFNENKTQAPQPTAQNNCLNINNQCLSLERVDTNQARIKGLSDRDSLAPNTGMLFVFEQPDDQCIWMKDMRFSIDIVWLDEMKAIKKIEPNVSPETYPASFCQDGTKYVMELNSGEAEKLGLQIGQKLSF